MFSKTVYNQEGLPATQFRLGSEKSVVCVSRSRCKHTMLSVFYTPVPFSPYTFLHWATMHFTFASVLSTIYKLFHFSIQFDLVVTICQNFF